VHFPWKQFADSGFGVWWGDTTNLAVPSNFNHMLAFRLIGYDTKDTTAVIQTFKRKYLQREDKLPLTEADRKVLYALYRRFE
jgi:N-acetylmuramoyl-L-alanine amidase